MSVSLLRPRGRGAPANLSGFARLTLRLARPPGSVYRDEVGEVFAVVRLATEGVSLAAGRRGEARG